MGDHLNRILVGECREQLASVPAGTFHCCVTSPPYFGLRSYLPKGHADKGKEIGSESGPEEFLAVMVDVFRAVRRVLRDDGVLFVNLGDSYGANGGDGGNLMNMPHRVAAALQADGWFWRSTIIWAKRSPMPESISGWRWVRCRVKSAERVEAPQGGLSSWDMGEHTHGPAGEYRGQEKTVPKWQPCPGCPKCDPNNGLVLRRGKWRPTTAHEYVFMFAKSERYFCDGDAVQERAEAFIKRGIGVTAGGAKSRSRDAGDDRGNSDFKSRIGNVVETRNPRSVWSLSSEPYKGSHFATFPTKLVKPLIEAATSKAGCCAECGAPWAPVVESERVPTRPGLNNKIWKHTNGDDVGQRSESSPNLDPQRHVAVTRTTGYLPTCRCNVPAVPCRVLDPFGGSGTTAQVAKALGRDWTICELNPEYVPLAEKRIEVVPKWAVPEPEKKPRKKAAPIALEQMGLFENFSPQPY